MEEQVPRLRTRPLRKSCWLGALAALSGSALARQTLVHEVHGNLAGEGFGAAVDALGDVNGDGACDWIVGGADAAQNGIGSGRVLVLSGADGSVLHELFGRVPGQGLGRSVSATGDVDGDGLADFALGELQGPRGPWSGGVRIHSGADGGLVRAWTGDAAYDAFGASIDGVGDLDGDGRDDLLIGAPGSDASFSDAGLARVVSGANGLTLREWTGASPLEAFGSAVCGLGDVDGDGVPDVAVGAPMHGASIAASRLGRVCVYSGQSGALLYDLLGVIAGAELGSSLAVVGDVDGDGRPDFVVGAPGDAQLHTEGGSVRLVSGRFGFVLQEWLGPEDSGRFGTCVAGLGDLDGDGVPEFGVASGAGTTAIRVYSGLDLEPRFELGAGSTDWVTARVAGGGDLDGDGYDDVLIGAPRADSNGMDAGSAYVFSGHEHVVAYCFGDGSGSPCPCFNPGGTGAGCANSTGSGATLGASGSASLDDDELSFGATHMPSHTSALLFGGAHAANGGAGVPFGDGLRCVTGGVERLGVRWADASGSASWGPGLAQVGGWSVGETRRFQAWYRDPPSPCGASFNLTNGVEVVFSY